MPSTHPLLQMFQILKCSKDTTRAIFFKGIGFKDIKCDIPLCHDSWMSCHEGHEYKTQHLLYFMSGLRNTLHANEAKRTIVLRTPFLLLGWRWKQWAEILWVGRSVSRDSLTKKGKPSHKKIIFNEQVSFFIKKSIFLCDGFPKGHFSPPGVIINLQSLEKVYSPWTKVRINSFIQSFTKVCFHLD